MLPFYTFFKIDVIRRASRGLQNRDDMSRYSENFGPPLVATSLSDALIFSITIFLLATQIIFLKIINIAPAPIRKVQ